MSPRRTRGAVAVLSERDARTIMADMLGPPVAEDADKLTERWRFRCPAHGDHPPGEPVQVTHDLRRGEWTLSCRACELEPLTAALGLELPDRAPRVKAGLAPVIEPPPPKPAPRTLGQADAVARKWLGKSYDLQALHVVLAVAAVEQLDGDPPWLLVVSGSGNAKTETVAALAGAGAHVTSTIKSEGALLSATAAKDRSRDATGGLLRKIGDRGLLVIKDVTSILSMSREIRGEVLAALREVADGRWERNVGSDGGQTLTWTGRIVLIGAVTTAYDAAHSVIAAMGDRFALVRTDSATGRMEAGRQALANVGHEVQMRAELAQVVGGVLAQVRPHAAVLADDDTHELLRLADLVTLSRTATERDGQGNVLDAHAPEMATRFAKALGQIVRGGLALGLDGADALALARRVARDTVPPLRLRLLADLLEHPLSSTADVVRRVQKPRTTVDRALQELHVLGLVCQHAYEREPWRYSLTSAVDPATLRSVSGNVSTKDIRIEEKAPPQDRGPALVADKSGAPFEQPSTRGQGSTVNGAAAVAPGAGIPAPLTLPGLDGDR